MYRLFLDDERFPIGDDWVIARNFDDAKREVETRGLMTYISFDHDLGPGPTGKDFAWWLTQYMLDHRAEFHASGFGYYVHSQNPVGADDIRGLMTGILKFLEDEKDVGLIDQAEAGSAGGPEGQKRT